jgi:hypothetical protein
MPCPPHHSLNRLFLSATDNTSAAPLAESLITSLADCLPHHSLHRSFAPLDDTLPAVPLNESLVSFPR